MTGWKCDMNAIGTRAGRNDLYSPWTLLCLLVLAMTCECALALAGSPAPVDGEGVLPPPLPIWPGDDETITERRPTLLINGRHGAKGYEAELARDSAFGDPIVLTEARVRDGAITPVVTMAHTGEPLADGVWYWRAFALDASGERTKVANYRRFRVALQPEHFIVKPGLAHPRLLFHAGQQGQLLERIKRSSHLQRGWIYQLNAARGIRGHTPPDEAYARAGKGQHGNYSTAASWYHRHMENVALMATLTGDDAMTRQAVDMLMTICGYERWLGPLFDDTKHFDPVWNSALETAMTTEAVAVGYDLLHDALTEAQRTTVREALVEKGIRPLIHDWVDPVGSSQIPRHQLPTGNWVMVCAGSAGLGALAVLDKHPEAEQWVRLVRNRVRAWFNDRGNDYYADPPNPGNRPFPIPVVGPTEPNFGVDGGYKESISYMSYGSRYALFFADALRRCTDADLLADVPEGMFDVMAWSLMAYPRDGGVETRIIDFGDCGTSVAWYGDLLACMIANRRDPLAAWIYKRVNPVPTSPRNLLWYDASVAESPPDATLPMAAFRTIGQVVMRRGWGPDTPMAAIKFHQNRGHHDLGTVFLYGQSSPTLIDSGSSHYGKPIYRQFSSRSIGHNVVLVDGQNQRWTDGELLAAVSTTRMSAAGGELSAAYPDRLERWTRDLVMLPNRQALILDRLKGKGERQYDLVLQPENPFTLGDESTLRIGGDVSRAEIHVASDGGFSPVVEDGYHKTIKRKYVRFNANERSTEREFLTYCRWLDPSEPSPAFAPPQRVGEGWRLEQENDAERLSVRVGPCEDDALRSDGRLTVVWREDVDRPGLHALLMDGQSLVVDGREVMRASRDVNVALETGPPMRVTAWAPEAVQLTLAVNEGVDHVARNGKPLGAKPREGKLTIDLPAGESDLRILGDGPACTESVRVIGDLLAVEIPQGPAFDERIVTRSSTSYSDVIDALDGDPNTAWHSLPTLPMPQWCEVELPEAESMSRVHLFTRYPVTGRVLGWDEAVGEAIELGPFETDESIPQAEIRFDPRKLRRLRVIFEKIDSANSSATLYTLDWE